MLAQQRSGSPRSEPQNENRDVRISWPLILERAAAIVRSYNTSEHPTGVTLRQLFYRLLSEPEPYKLPNTQVAYKALSRTTARARRAGNFPALIDETRKIEQRLFWADRADALRWLAQVYRLDRTEGQAGRVL